MSKIYLPFIGLLLCASSVNAQSSQSTADSLELNQIVVTASKIPLTQRETTKPVIVIDRREIEMNSGRDLSQLLNQQSGIRVNDSYGAPSNGRILYMQGATAQNTLILVDGLAINDPSGVGGLFDLRLLPMNNIERIEVIKGSQSTLYGTDAIAGVINIITRSGGDVPFNGTGKLSYGSYNTLKGSVGVNGSSGESVQYTINYNHESSDGFSAARDQGNSNSFEDDGFSMDSFYSKINFKPSDSITLTPSLNYSDSDGDYDGGAFQDAENRFELEMFNPGIQAVYNSSDIRVNAGYNYTRTQRLFVSEFGENEFEGRFHNADLFGNYSISNNLEVLAGLNHQDFNIPVDEQGESDREAQITSPYATLYLKNLSGFNAELGYRLNNHSEYGNNSTFSFAPSLNLMDNVKLFASVSTGFKAPTLDELFGPFGANPDLDPQRSLYFNAGFESYFMDESLKFSIQYFKRDIEDLIIYTFSDGYINRDEQNDYGIESTLDWVINRNVTLGTWYNYLNGEINTLNSEGDEVTTGNLIRRPAHSVGVNAGLRISDRLFVRVDGEFNSERTDLFFDPANNFSEEEVTLDAYTLVNFYTEYKLFDNQLTIFSDIKNLFNSDFTEVYGFNTTGTAINAGVRIDF
jgi:vitamin B12 transporter